MANLGSQAKRRIMAAVLKNPRFHSKVYLKKLLKTKRVRRITKDRVKRSSDELKADFMKTYLDLACNTAVVKVELDDEDMSRYNPLGIYDKTTEDWVKGVGGLQGEEEEVFEIEINENDLIDVVQFLKSNEKCKFRQLIDIAGVDYPENEKRFQLVYLFLSHEKPTIIYCHRSKM